jgi:hypothetical protein
MVEEAPPLDTSRNMRKWYRYERFSGASQFNEGFRAR